LSMFEKSGISDMRYEDNEMVRKRGMKTTKRIMRERERERGQRGCGTCSTGRAFLRSSWLQWLRTLESWMTEERCVGVGFWRERNRNIKK
jgi:hypothetical protein